MLDSFHPATPAPTGFRRRTLALLAVLLAVGLGSVRAEEVTWVHELESRSDLVGHRLTVEGRFSARVGQNRDQIRLQSSKVEFDLSPEAMRSFPSSLPRFVRVTGTLTKQTDGKLVMRVSEVEKITATDEERYAEVAGRILPGDQRAWYALAERTKALADFYRDTALRELAQEARVRGFRAEEAALRPPHADELLALAERAAERGVPNAAAETRRMRHKALRWTYDALARTGGGDDWRRLADRIAQLLPGAKTPRADGGNTPLAAYTADPISTYEREPAARDAFDRYLWVSANAERLASEAKAASPDYARLTEEAQRLLPERVPGVRAVLERLADAEAAGVVRLPARRMRELMRIYREDLGNAARSSALLRTWLDARHAELERPGNRDSEARYDLARSYLLDLGDRATAGTLLIEALQIEPGLEKATELLKSMGYVKSEKGWVANQVAALAPPAAPAAAPSALPQNDMTSDEVRQLLGDPEEIARLGTAGAISEQWIYKASAGHLYVDFLRTGSTPPRVSRVRSEPAKQIGAPR